MVNVEKEDLRVLVGDHNLYTISNSQKAIKVTAAGSSRLLAMALGEGEGGTPGL